MPDLSWDRRRDVPPQWKHTARPGDDVAVVVEHSGALGIPKVSTELKVPGLGRPKVNSKCL